MKNILFVLGNYYPRPSANGICVNEIIKECLKRGYGIYCLADKQYKKPTQRIALPIHIKYIRMPLDLYLLDRQTTSSNSILKFLLKIFIIFLLVLKKFISIFNFPIQKNRVLRYCREAEKIIHDNHIDVIIAENTPADCAYVGVLLKKSHPNIKLVSYFLDPLYGTFKNKILGKEKSNQRTLEIEKQIVQFSDLLIVFREHREHFEKFYSTDKDKFLYLGVPLLSNRISNSKCRLFPPREKIILYAGSISKQFRNPEYIIKCFKYVKKAKLIMYISSDHSWLKPLLKDNDNVTIFPRVSHEEISNIMSSVDGFLNIGNSLKNQSPSKIIEYISYGKPIITTFRDCYDTSLYYANKYPQSLKINESQETIIENAKLIDDFITQDQAMLQYSEIEKCFFSNTPQAFVDAAIKDLDNGEK